MPRRKKKQEVKRGKTRDCSFCENKVDLHYSDGFNVICLECFYDMYPIYTARLEKSYPANRHKHNISFEDYINFFHRQRGKCALCSKNTGNLRTEVLSLDHDHLTGVVRGFLCNSHNTMLGFAQDNIEVLQKAIKYLEKTQKYKLEE